MRQAFPDGFIIRSMEPADEAEWLRLRLALWPEDSAADHRLQMSDLRASARQAAIALQRPDNRLGGFVELSFHPRAIGCATHNVAYVEGWFVDADLRRRGWGEELMRAGEAWARRAGAVEIASDTQLDNKISLRGHLRLGYVEAGRLIHFAKRL